MSAAIVDALVKESERLAPDVFSLWLEAPEIVGSVRAGQFVSLYSHDGSHLLPRPISVCESDNMGCIRLVFRVVGYGTAEFSMMTPGQKIRIMGPLGNGFPLREDVVSNRKNIILIGGGIGIPPMIAVANDIIKMSNNNVLDTKSYGIEKDIDSKAIEESAHENNIDFRKRTHDHAIQKIEITTVLGYRDRHSFLSDELNKLSDNLYIATDDGSVGTHGTVIDALNHHGVTGDVIYACGPTPMLRGVKAWASEHGIPAYLSLEERMACGIGACLGCVTKTTEVDGHSLVNNARVCKDGPVFPAEMVDL